MFLTFGLPLIAGISAGVLGPALFGATSPGWLLESLFYYVGLLLSATNLPATLILSEVILIEQDALLFFDQFVDGRPITLFSPWIAFVVIYTLLALLLFWGTVRRVRRIPKS
jgi:hypothetical protein